MTNAISLCFTATTSTSVKTVGSTCAPLHVR